MGQYVAIDLHKRRSLIVRADENGERLETVRIDNDPVTLAQAVAAAGEDPEVVLEATCGWYWAADVLAEMGANVHLAHPLGLHWDNRRVKNDVRDANALLDMLRLDLVPEAWIAPPAVRELRELIRYRAKLVMLRAGLKSQVQAVLTKEGVSAGRYELWSAKGRRHLDELALGESFRTRVDSLCSLIDAYGHEIALLSTEIDGWLADDVGYGVIQSIKGVGPVLASSPKSAGSTASPVPTSSARGPASPPGIASPTPPCIGARSPNKGRVLFAGPPSRPSLGLATRRWPSSTPVSKSAEGPTWPGWPRRANFFTSSTTGCATARSSAV